MQLVLGTRVPRGASMSRELVAHGLQRADPVVRQDAELWIRSDGSQPVVVPDPSLLFRADFLRDGPDLVLVNADGQDVRVIDYFAHEAVTIVSGQGGRLSGATVESLAGAAAAGQYAQAAATAPDQLPIGQVEQVRGQATALRPDGTEVVLDVGTLVYQGDVVSTGDDGSLSITFVDETQFTLTANARMVLDELVYNPEGDGNSAVFNLVEGGFVFVAGQVARTGDMDVQTPTATLGIRGTTVLVEMTTTLGTFTVSVTLRQDFDTLEAGVIDLFDSSGNLITSITSTSTTWVIPLGGTPIEVQRTVADDADDAVLLTEAAAAFASVVNRLEAGELPVNFLDTRSEGPTADGGLPNDGTAPIGENLDDEGEGGPPTGGSGTNVTPESDGPETNGSTGGPTPTTQDVANPTVQLTLAAINLSTDEDEAVSGQLVVPSQVENPVISITSAPGNGSLALAQNGTFTFLPAPDFNGAVSFSYQATNAAGDTASGIVSIDVAPINDAPTGLPTAVLENGTEDTAYTVSEADLLAGFGDVDGDTLSVTGLTASNGAGVTDNEDGTYTITPAQHFNGSVTLTYTVSDGTEELTGESQTITFDAVNDAPEITVADDGAANETESGASTTGSIVFKDVDLNDTPQVTAAFKSAAYKAADGNTSLTLTNAQLLGLATALTITPDAGNANDGEATWSYATSDAAVDFLAEGETVALTYTITVDDGNADGATSEDIVITLTGTNDAPTLAADATLAAVEDGPEVDLDLTTLGDDVDSEDDGSTLTYEIVTVPAKGTAVIVDNIGTPTLVFDPGEEFQDLGDGQTESVTIEIKATDSNGASSQIQTVNVTVTGADEISSLGLVIAANDIFAGSHAIFSSGDNLLDGVSAPTGSSATDAQVESFLGLTSGTLDALTGENATTGSAIQFGQITIDEASTFSFSWSFTGVDGDPSEDFYGSGSYKDFAFFSVGSAISLIYQFDRDLFRPNIENQITSFDLQPGTYSFGFGSMNAGDSAYGAQLQISDIQIDPIPVTVASAYTGTDPIVLDLDGDGVELIGPQVAFDMNADGTASLMGWVGADDGLLVVDGDNSGQIEDGTEVFSEVFEGGSYDTSIEALRSFDSNADGMIDAGDQRFGEIKVWQDANSDGKTDAGELKPLDQLGIESLDLDAVPTQTDVNGNTVFAEGAYTTTDGGQETYVGVTFKDGGGASDSPSGGGGIPAYFPMESETGDPSDDPSGDGLPQLTDLLKVLDSKTTSIEKMIEGYTKSTRTEPGAERSDGASQPGSGGSVPLDGWKADPNAAGFVAPPDDDAAAGLDMLPVY
jgi:VCBS repeat-containing protein